MSKRLSDATRRDFLKRAGQGVAFVSAAGTLIGAHGDAAAQLRVPEPPGKKLGYAVVGLGSLAINQILPAFAKCEKSRVTALVSGSPEKARKLAERYGINEKSIYSYQNYDAIRDNPDVDIIYVVLPNSMHAEYTVRGSGAGKHVLCEKPMANTPKDCEQMIEACRKANRKLMIAYRLRYEPYNMTMIKMARAKEVGNLKIVTAEAGFSIGDPNQWRLKREMAGGGSLMDIGVYALNAARYITGEEPVEVNAMEYTTPGDPRFKEVEENINFQLRFPSGVLANCVSSYGAGINRWRATGDKGYIELDPALSYSGLKMRMRQGNRISDVELPQVDHFAAEMEHFSDCAMNNKEPTTPGEEGLKDLKVMMAIYEAAKTGKPIKLS
ncbi:MAG: Gfo/Idh/MocA family oxidoreductase [Pyrinomonadaceae bacterium]